MTADMDQTHNTAQHPMSNRYQMCGCLLPISFITALQQFGICTSFFDNGEKNLQKEKETH